MSWYKTGTIAVTNGSTTVTGSGTAWVGVVQPGWVFNAPDGKVYEVEAVVSATSLTLASAYLGSTQSGQDYGLFPTQGLTGDLVSAINALTTAAQGTIDGAGQGKFANGTLAAPGVRFTADENTGIRRSAADTLALVTGGVDRAVLAAAGLTLNVPLTGTAVQASASDTTAGRLMKVGAFGLGAIGPLLTDLTVTIPPGFWSYQEAAATGSPGSSAFANILFAGSTPGGGQGFLAFRQTTNVANQKFWFGSRTASTGAINWVEIRHQGNILGTVAQSGGVPTDAIIERGSNANGEYTRFADGTQTCWNTLSAGSILAQGSGTVDAPYETDSVGWTYPAAFVAAPAVTLTPEVPAGVAVSSRLLGTTYFSRTDTALTAIRAYRENFANATDVNVSIICRAEGRWV